MVPRSNGRKETQKDENGSAEIKLEQNMQKVNEDFYCSHGNPSGIGTEMEYRHPHSFRLISGISFKRVVSKQMTSPQSTLGGVETSVLSSGYK